jgi:indole-3-glycerol phosphate synthase
MTECDDDVNPELILNAKRQALAARKAKTPIEAIRALASLQKRPQPVLSTVTGGASTAIIGQICHAGAGTAYDPVAAALNLVRLGADALALFTDATVYDRGLNDLALVARAVDKPLISQDYVFDEYQVVELRASGASGVVLYADILDCAALRKLVSAVQRNRMTAIVQVSCVEQLPEIVSFSPQAVAVPIGASLYPHKLAHLRALIPSHIHLVVVEPLCDFDHAQAAACLHPDAVLAGAALLDHKETVERLRQLLNPTSCNES